jgi:hypothetical protein
MFHAISAGDADKIKALIGDGDFYSPLNSILLHKKLTGIYNDLDSAELQAEVSTMSRLYINR